jgi:hypothetical protein
MSEPFVSTARNREASNGSPEKSFLSRVRVANFGKVGSVASERLAHTSGEV